MAVVAVVAPVSGLFLAMWPLGLAPQVAYLLVQTPAAIIPTAFLKLQRDTGSGSRGRTT